MEAFRQFLKGWFGKLLLVCFLAPLAFMGVQSYSSSSSSSDILVSVGKRNITQRLFDHTYQQAKAEKLQRVGGNIALLNEQEIKKNVLENLIDKAVLESQARKLNLLLTDDQLTAIVKRNPAFQVNDKFSQNSFTEMLKKRGLNTKSYLAIKRDEMALVQIIRLITQTDFVTSSAKESLLKTFSEQRNVWMHKIDISDFTKDMKITDAETAEYFNKHKDSLLTKKMVDLQYISLDANDLMTADVTADEITAAYKLKIAAMKNNHELEQRKASHILFTGDTAQKTAEIVLAELKSGKSFTELAKQYSQHESSKDKGGQLDFLSKGEQEPAFENALFALENVGELTAVVTTSYGKHIIKLDEIKQLAIPTLEELKPELELVIKQRMREDSYQDLITKINQAALNGNSLSDIATDNKLTVKTAKDFTDDIINVAVLQGHGELNTPDVIKKAFDEFNLAEKAPSVGTKISDSNTVWIQSDNYRPVRNKTLAESTKEINTLLIKRKALESTKAQADTLVSTINTAKTVDDSKVEFDTLGKISRNAPMLSIQEINGIFSTVLPVDVDGSVNKDVVAKAVLTDDGYSVVAVQAVPAAEQTGFEENQKRQLSDQLSMLAGDESIKNYVRYLKANIEIERNEKAINSLISGDDSNS